MTFQSDYYAVVKNDFIIAKGDDRDKMLSIYHKLKQSSEIGDCLQFKTLRIKGRIQLKTLYELHI